MGLLLNAIYRTFLGGHWHMALSSEAAEILPSWLMHASAAALGAVLLAAVGAKTRQALRRRG